MNPRGERGLTLAELLVAMGLLAILVVTVAPMDQFLLRKQRELERAQAAGLDLSRAASALAADARRAAHSQAEPATLRLGLTDGTEIVWKMTRNGLERTGRSPAGGGLPRLVYPEVRSLEVSSPRSNLVGAVLSGAGERRRVAACLRNAGGGR